MPRSRYKKKSRRPPPLNSVSVGLTWENLLTAACWFISGLHDCSTQIATIAGVQFFGSTDWRVQSVVLLCENHASRIVPQRFLGSRRRAGQVVGRGFEFRSGNFSRR